MRPAQCALPDHANPPAVIAKLCCCTLIACCVAADLLLPECRSCGGHGSQVAVVRVPETPVDEQHGTTLCENQIGLTRKVALVQSVAQALRVEGLADDQLWLCVRASDAAHVQPSLLLSQNIHLAPPFGLAAILVDALHAFGDLVPCGRVLVGLPRFRLLEEVLITEF